MTSHVLVKERPQFVYAWMFGRKYDLLFYFLPLVLGFLCFLLSRSMILSTSPFLLLFALDAFGAGPFHWGPTWFAFFDKSNREYWKKNKAKSWVFFGGPPIVLALVLAGSWYCPWLVALVSMLWAIQHLVQQNVGILLLYHNHKDGEAVVDRLTEVRSQQAPAILFTAVFFWRVFLGQSTFILYPIIGTVLLAWAAYNVGAYLWRLHKLVRDGAYINVPSLIFWVLSVCALMPVALLGRTFNEGFVIPVTMHWFQYIGLNYMLVKYKYDKDEPRLADLPKMSPITLFAFAGLVWVLTVLVIHGLMTANVLTPFFSAMAAGVYIGLADIHYLHDAFLWRFREPFVRESILPYLLRARQSARPT